MFIRYQYYSGYIEILNGDILYALKKDIEKDYNEGILEYSQYESLIKRLDKKIKLNKFIDNI